MTRLAAIGAVAAAALAVAGRGGAQPPEQVVLPGPVPYPTVSPPLSAYSTTLVNPTHYVFHIASDQHVSVRVDQRGQPTAVRVGQRLEVVGRGDYQFGITGPIGDVAPAPGTQSQPGLRMNQLLWAGFSPGRKVLAADVTLRPGPAARYLPVRLELRRGGGGVTLTVSNATRARVVEYVGVTHPREIAGLLDATRRSALAGARVAPARATFVGTVGEREPQPLIAAPVHVEGELALAGGHAVRFAGTLGDGGPLTMRVHANGGGRAHLALGAVPVPVSRLLRPPRGRSWKAAVARRPLPAAFLLRRLMDTRYMLVRADQYRTFLANPDADGRNTIVYDYRTAEQAPRPAVSATPAPSSSGGGASELLVLLAAIGGSVLAAGAAVVAWAHS